MSPNLLFLAFFRSQSEYNANMAIEAYLYKPSLTSASFKLNRGDVYLLARCLIYVQLVSVLIVFLRGILEVVREHAREKLRWPLSVTLCRHPRSLQKLRDGCLVKLQLD